MADLRLRDAAAVLLGDDHKSRSPAASGASSAAAEGTTSAQVDVLRQRVPNAAAASAADSAVTTADATAIPGDSGEDPGTYFSHWRMDDRSHHVSANAREESSSADREGMASTVQARSAASRRDSLAAGSNDGDVAVRNLAASASAVAPGDIRSPAHSRLLAPWSIDDSTQAFFGERQPQLSMEFAPFAPSSLSKEVHLVTPSRRESEEGRADFWNADAEGSAAGGEPIDVEAFLREFKRSEHSGDGESGTAKVRRYVALRPLDVLLWTAVFLCEHVGMSFKTTTSLCTLQGQSYFSRLAVEHRCLRWRVALPFLTVTNLDEPTVPWSLTSVSCLCCEDAVES